MKSIVIDQEAAERLSRCRETVVLRDAAGNFIGYFDPPPRIYEEGKLPEFDEEELSRRVERWQGIPSAEVRKRLEELM